MGMTTQTTSTHNQSCIESSNCRVWNNVSLLAKHFNNVFKLLFNIGREILHPVRREIFLIPIDSKFKRFRPYTLDLTSKWITDNTLWIAMSGDVICIWYVLATCLLWFPSRHYAEPAIMQPGMPKRSIKNLRSTTWPRQDTVSFSRIPRLIKVAMA